MSGRHVGKVPAQSGDRWTVGRWMTDIPLAVTPHVSVRAAFMKMRIGHFRHLLVMENGELVGIVTDRDLRRPDVSHDAEGWSDLYRVDEHTTVREVMTSAVETVGPADSLSKAVSLFVSRKYGALPVVDDSGVVRGILSTIDVLRALDELLPRE